MHGDLGLWSQGLIRPFDWFQWLSTSVSPFCSRSLKLKLTRRCLRIWAGRDRPTPITACLGKGRIRHNPRVLQVCSCFPAIGICFCESPFTSGPTRPVFWIPRGSSSRLFSQTGVLQLECLGPLG